MLRYAVARLADKRTSNLTVLLTRPRPLLAFRGARGGKQRASLCLLRPKGRWGWVGGRWWDGSYCVRNPNDWHVFTPAFGLMVIRVKLPFSVKACGHATPQLDRV